MGKVYDQITPQIAAWIKRQKMFFVATASLSADTHVNCSPKGLNTFHILSDREVCYFDFTGSGAETIAHLRENGRIVLMFCAFDGPPKIVRLHGQGKIVTPGDTRWSELAQHFNQTEKPRCFIKVDVTRISDSCGFGVPLMTFEAERDSIAQWAKGKSDTDLADYRRLKNAQSIDGLAAWDEP
jgi:hypothetical protein